MKKLSIAERLVVAADFGASEHLYPDQLRSKILSLADSLSETGVTIKVNSALRACGYSLIKEIQSRGLKVFADLKLYDIEETLSTDAALLCWAPPDMLTMVCLHSVRTLRLVARLMLETEVLGVTVLTSMNEKECWDFHGRTVEWTSKGLADRARRAGLGGIICSAKEAKQLRKLLGRSKTINCPAIRPKWSMVPGDDQNPRRISTPGQAIASGADRIIVGRPIRWSDDPYDSVMRTLDEIEIAVNKLLS